MLLSVPLTRVYFPEPSIAEVTSASAYWPPVTGPVSPTGGELKSGIGALFQVMVSSFQSPSVDHRLAPSRDELPVQQRKVAPVTDMPSGIWSLELEEAVRLGTGVHPHPVGRAKVAVRLARTDRRRLVGLHGERGVRPGRGDVQLERGESGGQQRKVSSTVLKNRLGNANRYCILAHSWAQ